MGRFGAGVGLLASYLAGAAGNLVSLWFNAKPFVGLGASGMVMGALGLLAAQTFTYWQFEHKRLQNLIGGLAAGIMLFLWFSLSPASDFAAHLGGFTAGLAMGSALSFVPIRHLRGAKVSASASFLLLAWLAFTWRLALAGAPSAVNSAS
jgi:membrane associated rhomboid family serine protease